MLCAGFYTVSKAHDTFFAFLSSEARAENEPET